MAAYHPVAQFLVAGFLMLLPSKGFAMDSNLITKPSSHSVRETIDRFEEAVKAKDWMVFTELDHSAAAAKYGLKMRARTVILFGNPKGGTAGMQKTPTLAIDLPQRALVWEDDQGKVFLTYNSAEFIGNYVFPRHGLDTPAPSGAQSQVLTEITDKATK